MIDDDDAPSPHQLADNPELAILAALDKTLLMAEHALIAAHPLLTSGLDPPDDDERAWRALRLVGFAIALADEIAGYRRALRLRTRRAS